MYLLEESGSNGIKFLFHITRGVGVPVTSHGRRTDSSTMISSFSSRLPEIRGATGLEKQALYSHTCFFLDSRKEKAAIKFMVVHTEYSSVLTVISMIFEGQSVF